MKKQVTLSKPKIWGGIECTINRVGNEYKDQLEYSGHYDRPGDIEAIAALGIKTIRYPLLWEKHQPERDVAIDWSWSDRQLETIQNFEMKPIAGLVHHGSGPAFTNLLDPEFPYLLCDYAYEVANRYPWIEDYTPVNEPLTTARFSGLYGLWYPHHTDETSFYRMLLNQLKATVLSMEAIRSVNPSARLIQTEDLGKTYSTKLLSYQADFENDRRLLTYDILTGRLRPGHPQYSYMLGCGIREDEIDFFHANQMPPDVIGLNYYVTSERWLDESFEKYPVNTHGGNGKHRYADTEVVRANMFARGGFKMLATEIWERYRIGMAVTEAHLHCTREEQLRWFKELWDETITLSDKGVNIEGVTAWALLGSFDWDTLLTKTGTQYESGVFDIKSFSDELRPTALAALLKSLSGNKTELHPVLSAPGWWHPPVNMPTKNCRPILIVKEASDNYFDDKDIDEMMTLFIYACDQRRIRSIPAINPDEKFVEKISPWAVLNLGSNNVKLQSICQKRDLQFINLSRDNHVHQGLNIVAEQLPITIHQANKILDLIIDGEQGCWIAGSDEVVFKHGIHLLHNEPLNAEKYGIYSRMN